MHVYYFVDSESRNQYKVVIRNIDYRELMEFDQLNDLLARITKQLEEKQAEFIRVSEELQVLRQRAKSLEDTRAMLIEARTATDYHALIAAKKTAVSLQDEVLKIIGAADPDTGVAITDVVAELKNSKYPKSDSKSFYATVFTTVKRLVGKGKVDEYTATESKQKLYRVAKDNLTLDATEGVIR